MVAGGVELKNSPSRGEKLTLVGEKSEPHLWQGGQKTAPIVVGDKTRHQLCGAEMPPLPHMGLWV